MARKAKRVTIKIDTVNGAFHEEGGGEGVETARILRKMADVLEAEVEPWEVSCPVTFADINGNKVGELRLT